MQVIADPRVANVRIKELAYNLGYRHPSAFTRAFRKRFGVLPSEVRKREAGAFTALRGSSPSAPSISVPRPSIARPWRCPLTTWLTIRSLTAGFYVSAASP